MAERKMLSDYPELVKEWDFEKNNEIGIYPEEHTAGSNKIVWWKCSKKHSYDSKISTRSRTSGCPYCSNQRILRGYNDFESQRPELMKFWNYSKNTILPYELSPNSGKMVWWVCELGHDFENTPNMMSKGRKCPYCSNKKVLIGFNDAATINPELISLWSDKNNSSIYDYVFGSAKKVWWKCIKGHEFETSIRSMVKKSTVCSTCSNKKVLSGFNDVATVKPELLKYWDYEKNIYQPSEITIGRSADKTHLICDNGHSFSSTLADINQGKWCLQCSVESYVSKPEKEIAIFLKNELDFSLESSNRQLIAPYEVDLYIPEKNLAIEFNGLFWHSEEYMQRIGRRNIQYYHYYKWNLCRKQGVQLITVWEDDWRDNHTLVKSMLKHKLGVNNEHKIYARKSYGKEISSVEAELLLNQTHIQGFKNMTKSYGLLNKENDELVAVLSFSINKNIASLDRYATSYSVVGGFTKLLKYSIAEIKKSNSEIDTITTFADNEVSDGGLYKNNGFVVDSYVSPDYKYIYKSKRHHKFLFRKKRFENDPELLFDENMTEKELAALNKINRVWDCGKTKYVKHINKNI